MKQANVPCATLQLRNVLLKFALPNTLAWINTRSSLGVGHHYPHAIHHAAHWAWPKWNFMRFYGNNVISDLRKETTSLSTTMLWLDQVMGSIHRDTMNNAWSSNTIQGWDKLNESSACMYVCHLIDYQWNIDTSIMWPYFASVRDWDKGLIESIQSRLDKEEVQIFKMDNVQPSPPKYMGTTRSHNSQSVI